jgi:hypothetical protein
MALYRTVFIGKDQYNVKASDGSIYNAKSPNGLFYQGGTPVTDPDKLTLINNILNEAGLAPIDASGNHSGAAPNPTNNPQPAGTTPTTPNSNNSDKKYGNILPNTITDRLSSTSLSYPKNLGTTQTYLQFKSFDYSTIQQSPGVYGVGSGIVGDISKQLITSASQSVEKQTYNTDTINLYAPPGINISYGANWGSASLGLLGNTKLAGSDIQSALTTAMTAASQGLIQIGADKLSEIMGKIPNFNATGEQIIGLTTGLLYNKNEFSTFSNMNFRTFSYSFLFVARNQEETREINKIINVFKIGMHPAGTNAGIAAGTISYESGGSASFKAVAQNPVLKYPKLWTIRYKLNENDNQYIPKTKFCALIDLKLNYTPSSLFTTLTDGEIPAIQMDLAFRELTPLTADEIQNSNLVNTGVFKGNLNSDYSQNGAIF